MLNVRQILVSALGLAILGVALTACGQRGALYLPTDPIAKDRTTLPGLLLPTPAAQPDPAQKAPAAGSTTAPAAQPVAPPAGSPPAGAAR